MYLIDRKGTVPLIKSSLLSEEPGIIHGFTTREGGVSTGHLATLNLSFTRGDKEENVRENYRRLAETIGIPEDRFVTTQQTHTVNIRIAAEKDAGKGITRPRTYKNIDGLVTNERNLVLTVFIADCVPVLLYDPVHEAIGAVHSGWRGTVGRISREALWIMREEYGTDPADVLAAIGPSICRDCYEVSADVAEQFRETFDISRISSWEAAGETGLPDKGRGDILYRKENGHYQLDLWSAIRKTLLLEGVPDRQIDILGACTAANSDRLFSHRATGGKRGNMAAVIALL